ncbi:MAG: A/G-specific adenine glycosylase [Lactobacillus sp.]|jgi:A/G-specific adenine glycosylase|nr:A/G-specific adenine glycosylase [Lactobacillus sp.]
MTPKDITAFQTTFLTWYDANKRDLPWRRNHDPYLVWLSEVMLQQTQVQTVLPYFQRFTQALPNLTALAAVDDAQLLKLWEGLGYYSRARNLKKAAQQLLADYDGHFPQTASELENIIGIGPYTAGAIASIAFEEVVPAVDGNAYRVFSRLLADDFDISQSKARAHFAQEIQPLLPKKRPGDFNQAVMDLGSSICTTKDPACLLCPIQAYCTSYQTGSQLDFPVKTKKIRQKKVQLIALVIQNDQGAYLLQQRPEQGLLGGLTTLPLVALDDLDLAEQTKPQAIQAYFAANYDLALTQVQDLKLKPVVHVFTHLHWTIHLFAAKLGDPQADVAYFPGYFVPKAQLGNQAQATLQKKLLKRANLSKK